MSYIGQNLPSNSFIGYTTDTFAGDGSTTAFTMSKAPFSESAVIVVINNVVQQPTADFTISGTTLTIDAAVADGDVIYATHIGGALPIGQANKLVSNNLTVNDTEIDLSSGDLTVDVAGEIILDADGGRLKFQDGGTEIFQINNGSSNANLKSTVQDKDIRLQGNDGGATITALTLDMSDAGAATLNNGLTLTDGNITLASGHGINFAATADGTTMSSELLDDYEEGTWTIVLEDHSDNAFTLNSSQTTGTYIKIGGQVTITGYFIATAINSASGSSRISGLPFNILGNDRNYAAMTIGFAAGLNITAGTSVAGVGIINSANVNFTNFDVAAGTTNLQCGTLNDSDALVDKDISGEDAEVQAVANAVWTDAVKAAYKTWLIDNKPS